MSGSRTGTNLFLLELLPAILVFAFAAAVCMQIFAFARNRANESRNLSSAVLAAESAAECWKAADGDLEETARMLDGACGNGGVTVWYERDWMPCAQPQASFRLTLAADGERAARITVFAGGDVLYTLSVRRTGGGG